MTKLYSTQMMKSPAYGSSAQNEIAYCRSQGKAQSSGQNGMIWCGGLKSDMDGTKALALHEFADDQDLDFVRFDYFGHGQSTGLFREGTLSRWAADIVQVLDELSDGPQILIGSSMGAWASLLAAKARPDLVAGLVLIAPAADFTHKLMWERFDESIRATIMQEGIYYEPSDYDEPYEISRELILDGREVQVLDAPIKFDGPVRILQGMCDTSVPWRHAQKLISVLSSDDVEMSLVKDGDHSLSRPQDLVRLIKTVKALV